MVLAAEFIWEIYIRMTISMNTTEELGFCLLTTFLKVPPSPAIIRANIIRAVANTVLLVICICANLAFLKAYNNSPRLRNTSNLLLANLAVSDLLVGCIGQPLFILRGILEIFAFHDCVLWNIEKVAVLFLCSVSFAMLLLISMERAVATFVPLRYSAICYPSHVCPIAACVWITCLISLILLVHSSSAYYILLALFILTISVLMTIMHCSMCFEARQQRRKINNSGFQWENKCRLSFHKNKKAEKTISWVVGALFACYFPITFYLVSVTFRGNSVFSLYVIASYLTTLVFLNSSLNPVIYCWRNRTIRMAVKRVILDTRFRVLIKRS